MSRSDYATLLRAIRSHSGLELGAIRDAGAHGADAGWAGFTYTTDAADFYRTHRDVIWSILDQDAAEFGYDSVPAFVATFKRADMTCTADGFDCLLAWYALEEVGRYSVDRKESR